MPNRANSSAFTLIELLVVITVLALVAATVTPSLISMKATSDRRDVMSALRRVAGEAREDAIRSGKSTQLIFDESARELRIERVEDDGSTTPVRNVPITSDFEPQRYQMEGKDTTAGEFNVTFTADGRSNGGGIEFANFALLVEQSGGWRFMDGPLPNPEDERWQAGELEQRQ